MEPVGAHGLAPVAPDGDGVARRSLQARGAVVHEQRLARCRGESGSRVGRRGVEGVVAPQLHGPAVVVELPGEEEGVGEAIALGGVVAVVLMGADGVQPEAPIGRRIDGQGVVVPHEHRLAIARHEQLGRHRPVEGPHGLVFLDGHAGVDAHRNALGGTFRSREAGGVVVEATEAELTGLIAVHLMGVPEAAIDPGSGLGGLEVDRGLELIPALVGPAWPRRATLRRGGVQRPTQEAFDLRLPGVQVPGVRVLRGPGGDARLGQEGFQSGAGRHAGSHAGGILLGQWAHGGRGKTLARHRAVGVQGLRTELLEEQHLLDVGLGPEHRAGLAVGRDVEGSRRYLEGGRQHVAGARIGLGAGHAALEGTLVGRELGGGLGRGYREQGPCHQEQAHVQAVSEHHVPP